MLDVKAYADKLREMRASYMKRIEAIHVDTHHTEEPVEKDFAEQAKRIQRKNND